jgi:hypothetical protein
MWTKRIFGFLLAAVSAAAQSTNTAGMANGRFWNSLASGEKKAYLIGYWDDWALHASTRTNPAPDGGIEEEYYPRSLGFEEVAKSLDAFYRAPENLNIQIRYALRILTLKAAGIPDRRVQGEVLFFRCITDHFTKDGHIKEVAVAENVIRTCKEANPDPLPEKKSDLKEETPPKDTRN